MGCRVPFGEFSMRLWAYAPGHPQGGGGGVSENSGWMSPPHQCPRGQGCSAQSYKHHSYDMTAIPATMQTHCKHTVHMTRKLGGYAQAECIQRRDSGSAPKGPCPVATTVVAQPVRLRRWGLALLLTLLSYRLEYFWRVTHKGVGVGGAWRR